MKIRALLIDLDGTLIDSIPLIMASDKEAIEHFGFKITHQELRELSQLHSREIAYHLMDSTKRVFDLFAFVEYRRSAFVKLLHKKKPLWFKDAEPFLMEMRSRYLLALVTGSRKIFVKEIFDDKKKRLFKSIITSDDVEHKKPDVESALKALKKLRVQSKEVLYIGDSVLDGLMCQRLGIKFIAKLGGIATEHELRKYAPVFASKDFAEIAKFIEETDF